MARMTRLEKRRAMWKAAMPEVKRLVSKFDRGAVAHCLKVMADKEALARQIASLREKAELLQRKL